MKYVIDLDKNIPEQIVKIGEDLNKTDKKPSFVVRAWNRIKSCF